jgi:hypothetical protein
LAQFLLEIDEFILIMNAIIVCETFLLSRNISVYFKDMISESFMHSYTSLLLIDKPYGSLQVIKRINKPNPFEIGMLQ